MEHRLRSEVWIMAHVRRCIAQGLNVVVVRRGESERGTLILKLNQLERDVRVLSQARDIDGRLGWLAAFDGQAVKEADADAYIARAIGRDPDLWVIEIEDREGRHPFEGPIL
jgi:hypothetical protein